MPPSPAGPRPTRPSEPGPAQRLTAAQGLPERSARGTAGRGGAGQGGPLGGERRWVERTEAVKVDK